MTAATGVISDTQTSGANQEGYSQATERTFRIFRDQHGREYGADVEKSTNHPCGPVSPRFRAPMYPPEYYMVIVDTIRSLLHIDYERWLSDLARAHEDYATEMFTAAVDMYADKAADAVDKKPRALLMRVGPPPMAMEPIQAMAAENPWMLGRRGAVKPKLAALYFPEVPVPQYTTVEETGIVTRKFDDPFAEGEPVAVIEYPYMYAPGRWYLSAQHRNQVEAGLTDAFKGKRDDALAEIARIQASDPFTED